MLLSVLTFRLLGSFEVTKRLVHRYLGDPNPYTPGLATTAPQRGRSTSAWGAKFSQFPIQTTNRQCFDSHRQISNRTRKNISCKKLSRTWTC